MKQGGTDQALGVEQCYCPPQYTGLSCQVSQAQTHSCSKCIRYPPELIHTIFNSFSARIADKMYLQFKPVVHMEAACADSRHS